jgi:hypothetical protein
MPVYVHVLSRAGIASAHIACVACMQAPLCTKHVVPCYCWPVRHQVISGILGGELATSVREIENTTFSPCMGKRTESEGRIHAD